MSNLQIFVILGLSSIFVVNSQIPNLENVGDILKSLKDSGMMDNFEKDLKQMLFQQEAFVKPKEKSKATQEPETDGPQTVDTYEFIKAYSAERGLTLNEKVTLYLMDLPVKDDISSHLAKLTVIMDKIGEISKYQNKKVDGKVVEATKRIRALSILKTSLEKLLVEAQNEVGEAKEVKKVEEVTPKVDKKIQNSVAEATSKSKQMKSESENVANAVTTFLEMIKARPEQMISFVTTAISAYDLLSAETLRMVEMYGKMFSKTEYFNLVIDTLINVVEEGANTELGARIAELGPKILQSGSPQVALELILRELEGTKSGLLSYVQNPETGNKALDFVASMTASGLGFFNDLLKDDMKITFANTFLLSQGLPSINSRKVIQSGSRLIDRLIKTFTAWDVDIKTHEKVAQSFVTNFEENYVPWSKYGNLKHQDQVGVIKKFLSENFFEAGALLYEAHVQATKDPQCSQAIICKVKHGISENLRGSQVKGAITRGLSIMAAWAWSMEGKGDYSSLYEAIWEDDCETKYSESCRAYFAKANLTLGHSEL